MKRLVLCILALASVAVLPACRTTSNIEQTDVNKHPERKGDPALVKVGEGVLKAIRDNDYEMFTLYLGNKGETLSETDFSASGRNMAGQFGKIANWEYLTDLETPAVHNLIWKVGFERVGENQKSVKQDLLFRAVIGTVDGKPSVISIGFF